MTAIIILLLQYNGKFFVGTNFRTSDQNVFKCMAALHITMQFINTCTKGAMCVKMV